MTVLSLTGGLAMDLGTANTLIYRQGSGIVLNEPSLAVLETETRRVLAVGGEAKSYMGRTPQGLEVVRPLRRGAISDFAVARAMIRHFLARAGVSRRLFRPRVVVGLPSGATQMEKQAVIEAAEEAGGRYVRLVDEPLAAAIGLGLNIAEPTARMVLDVGGGTSEGVIVSLGVVAFSGSRRLGGDEATLAVIQHLRHKYALAVGENTAERIKMTIGSASPLPPAAGDDPAEPPKTTNAAAPPSFQGRGKETVTGLPKVMELAPSDISEALEGVTREFVKLVRLLLNQAPPELTADLKELHLTGGGSLLAGLSERLTRDTGLAVRVPEDPRLSMVLGLGEILENIPRYKSVLIN